MKALSFKKTLATGVTAVALAALSIAAAPAASAASGGGCAGWFGAYGYSAKSCISDSGLTLEPNGIGSGSHNGSVNWCDLDVYLLDASGNTLSDGYYSCTSGNHTPSSVWELAGQYRTETCLDMGYGTKTLEYFCEFSPWQYQQ
jgi:hypothetical protein